MTIFTDGDPELDALLRECDPVDQNTLHAVAISPAATALRDAISQPAAAPATRRRFLRPAVLAAAAVIAVAATLSVTLIRPSAGGTAYADSLVRFAENSPRLLVGVDGWRVTRADQEDAQTGEMTFSAGVKSLDLFWVPGASSKDSDKADLIAAGTAQIDGQSAYVGHYGTDYEAIWAVGDQAIEARGTFATRADFLAIAGRLHRVDVDTWLSALPASVISPASRAATVDTMLADVPLPAGFDISALTSSGLVSDRYQLGAKVTGAVSCAWIHQWANGNSVQRDEAAAAMATSPHWAILQQMRADGAYPSVVWEIAGAMNGKPLTITPGETLEQWSQSALGC